MKREKSIFVRVDSKSKGLFARAAHQAGETLSGWIRRILMKEAERSEAKRVVKR